MRIPSFSAEASLVRSNVEHRSRPQIDESRRVFAIPQDLGSDGIATIGYRMPETCTVAWVLCTLWQDPWSCFVYYTLPQCNPLHVSG
jgi:hypothetical protein